MGAATGFIFHILMTSDESIGLVGWKVYARITRIISYNEILPESRLRADTLENNYIVTNSTDVHVCLYMYCNYM